MHLARHPHARWRPVLRFADAPTAAIAVVPTRAIPVVPDDRLVPPVSNDRLVPADFSEEVALTSPIPLPRHPHPHPAREGAPARQPSSRPSGARGTPATD